MAITKLNPNQVPVAGFASGIYPAGTSTQYWRGDNVWATLDKTAVGLSNVENTALSTWTGSTTITTLGTIATCGGLTTTGSITLPNGNTLTGDILNGNVHVDFTGGVTCNGKVIGTEISASTRIDSPLYWCYSTSPTNGILGQFQGQYNGDCGFKIWNSDNNSKSASALDLKGYAATFAFYVYSTAYNSSSDARMFNSSLFTGNYIAGDWAHILGFNPIAGILINTAGSYPLLFGTGNYERIRVGGTTSDAVGYVTIGGIARSGSAVLTVNGAIVATNIGTMAAETATNYVPYTGAGSDVNLGTHTLASGAITSSGNISLTSASNINLKINHSGVGIDWRVGIKDAASELLLDCSTADLTAPMFKFYGNGDFQHIGNSFASTTGDKHAVGARGETKFFRQAEDANGLVGMGAKVEASTAPAGGSQGSLHFYTWNYGVINSTDVMTLDGNGNLSLSRGTLTLPSSNTMTGIANYVSFNNGIKFNGNLDAGANNVAIGDVSGVSSAYQLRINPTTGVFQYGDKFADNSNNIEFDITNRTFKVGDIDGDGSTSGSKLVYDIGNSSLVLSRFDGASTDIFSISHGGDLTILGKFGCNSKTAQTAYASGGAVTTGAGLFGFTSDTERSNLTALVANIRTALVNNGIMS